MASAASPKPRVFVTGASGRVFAGIKDALTPHFDFVLTDALINENTPPGTQQLDITDFQQVREKLRDVDILLHLAIASWYHMRDWQPWEQFDYEMKVNVIGTQHLFEAAWLAGVKRIVYMSSLTVVLGRPTPKTIPRDMPPRPRGLYGCTKLFGETLADYYSRQHGMTVICLRLGQPIPVPDWDYNSPREVNARPAGCNCDMADVAEGVRCALTVQDVQFAIANLVSASESSAVDLSAAAEIGYQPTRRFTANGIEVIREPSHA